MGLRNYIDVFADMDFTRALQNSLTFMIVVTAAQTVLALFLAIILNQRIRGLGFRAAYYMPSVASSVVVTLIFIWFFQRRGC